MPETEKIDVAVGDIVRADDGLEYEVLNIVHYYADSRSDEVVLLNTEFGLSFCLIDEITFVIRKTDRIAEVSHALLACRNNAVNYMFDVQRLHDKGRWDYGSTAALSIELTKLQVLESKLNELDPTSEHIN